LTATLEPAATPLRPHPNPPHDKASAVTKPSPAATSMPEEPFFWREDHEAIVAAEREASYRDGYDQGFAAGSHQRPVTVVVRPARRRRIRRLAVLAFVLFIVVSYAADVLLPVLNRLV